MEDMNIKAKEFAELVTEISEIEAELRRKKQRRDELQEELLDYFTSPNAPEAISIGGRTMWPQRQVWVSVKEGAMEVLKQHGLGDMVKEKVNSQTLSAWYREQESENAVPMWADEAFNVTEKYRIGTKKKS